MAAGSAHCAIWRLISRAACAIGPELRRWRNLTGPEYSEFVFFNPTDKKKHLLKLPKTWRSALKKAKIGYSPIYNLRHTFATRGNACEIPPITLAQLIGHSSTGIIQTYAKVVENLQSNRVD